MELGRLPERPSSCGDLIRRNFVLLVEAIKLQEVEKAQNVSEFLQLFSPINHSF
jgi:hypothetical protein